MNLNSIFLFNSHQKILKTIKGLMLCRIIILTLLLTITFLFQISERKYFFFPMTNNFYYYVGFFYLVTILYSIVFNRIKDFYRFTFIQIIIDHLFIIGLIYFTGGKESFFSLTFIFIIIGTSIIFYKRGAFFSASFSSFLYGLLLLLQFNHWITPLGQSPAYDASQIFYSLIIYMATFYIVAFLSSMISEELKKKGRELIQKQVDYDQLEHFNRDVIQSLDSGLLTINPYGKINFLNHTAEKILGMNEERLKNISIYELFPRINEAIDEMNIKQPHAFSDYQRYETIFTNHEGKKIYLGASISPLHDTDGVLIGYTLIFKDITKFKDMEEQMKRFDKMAAVGLLAAGMAHEIRNPLASLSGSIQMLKSELLLDHQQKRLMEIALMESERLNALMTDFLLFAQPPQTNKVFLDMKKIIEETVEIFIHSSSFHDGIHIVEPVHPKKIQVMIDPDQMKQVLWNLLLNATQSMSNGGEIKIDIEKGNDVFFGISPMMLTHYIGKEWVKISITDSGVGISPEEKEKIFEPFFTTKERGTGLGLSIVHKIVENHNGFVKVESEIGKGSTFSIFMPTDSLTD